MLRQALLLALLLTPAAQAFPSPERLLERDAVSVAVVQARPDDPGFRALLQNAWKSMRSRELPPFLAMALRLMGRGSEEEGLLSFLPAQAVRVDRLTEGRLEPTFAVSVTGWQGLQGQYFHSLTKDAEGEPWPTRTSSGQTLVVREKDVLARVEGTFLHCPTPERAEAAVRALTAANPQPPQTRLLYALQRAERDSDLYGVMLNQDAGVLRFLEWLEIVDLERLGDDLPDLSTHVLLMAWDGDLVDDDELRLHARFETDGPEAADRLAQVLHEARGEFTRRKRLGHWQVGTSGSEVDLRFSLVGFREAVQGFVRER